jgi:hypothetical protein
MPKRKSKGTPSKPRTPAEAEIARRGRELVERIRSYWQAEDRLNGTFPPAPSGLIWLLRDGAVFIRHKDITAGTTPPVPQYSPSTTQIRVEDVSLNDWFDTKWIVPVNGRDTSLSDLNIIKGPANNFTFVNLGFKTPATVQKFSGGVHIGYLNARMEMSKKKNCRNFSRTIRS